MDDVDAECTRTCVCMCSVDVEVLELRLCQQRRIPAAINNTHLLFEMAEYIRSSTLSVSEAVLARR